MAKTRSKVGDHKHHSDTLAIQDKLQVINVAEFKVVVDEDTFEGIEKIHVYRNEEIQRIEKDVRIVKDMFSDLAQLVDGQQCDINRVEKTLISAHKHVEGADKIIAEVDNKKCIIL